MKPTTMFHDRELEEAYILKCISENKLKMGELHKDFKSGVKDRYITDYEKTKKIGYKLFPNYYIIDSIDNFKGVITARDGGSKTVPLFRPVELRENETRVPFAETIEGSSRGVIEEIVDYNPRSKTAKVKFKGSDDKYELQTIPSRYIREQIPTRVSDLEMEFLERNGDRYVLEGRYLEHKNQVLHRYK